MRWLIVPILILTLFLVIGTFLIVGFYQISIKAAQAADYSPLDFASECQEFKVSVGIDQDKGRFITYSCEYLDN